LVRPLTGLGEGGEDLQAPHHMADGLEVRRALQGTLPSALPVGERLRTQARLGVMVRQQFRLGLHRLGKLRLQHVRNALVILLTCTLQQRLIRGILNEGMLEEVRRLRQESPLIQQLCFD
jgi:hypothetical protein